MNRATLTINISCVGATPEEAEMNLLEECAAQMSIEKVDAAESDNACDEGNANFEAQRLDDKYDGVPADTTDDTWAMRVFNGQI